MGQAIDDAPSRKVDGAGYLLEGRSRNVWRSGHEVATFDAREIFECSATAARMLETMETDGVAVVHNAGKPTAFDLDADAASRPDSWPYVGDTAAVVSDVSDITPSL